MKLQIPDLDTYKSIVNGTQTVVDAVNGENMKFTRNIRGLEDFVAMFDPSIKWILIQVSILQ
jgi:hypothetical protein